MPRHTEPSAAAGPAGGPTSRPSRITCRPSRPGSRSGSRLRFLREPRPRSRTRAGDHDLQHVVSRNTPPLDSVVVFVTRTSAGTTDNIIPEAVERGGTVRTLRQELREQTHVAIE